MEKTNFGDLYLIKAVNNSYELFSTSFTYHKTKAESFYKLKTIINKTDIFYDRVILFHKYLPKQKYPNFVCLFFRYCQK